MKSNINNIFGGMQALLAFAGALAIFGVILSSGLSSCSNENAENSSDSTSMEVKDSVSLINTQMDETEKQMARMKINVEQPVFDEESGTYSLKTTIANGSSDMKYHFQLLLPFEDKVVAESDNGEFTQIPPSPDKEGWAYRVVVKAEKDGKIVETAENQATGFIYQEKVDKKMTVAQLQSLIDKRDPDLLGVGESKYLSPELKLVFKGMTKDDIEPQIMQEVFDKLDFEVWKAAKVTNMKFDSMNRICEITFQVVH